MISASATSPPADSPPVPAASTADALRSLVQGSEVAMLATVDAEGELRSQPMQTQQVDDSGTIWFLASRASELVAGLQGEAQVNLSYSHPGDQRYVSLTGRAEIVDDAEQRHARWKTSDRVWFKEGPDDPDLVLLRVAVRRADYWQAPRGAPMRLAGSAGAPLAGDDAALGRRGGWDLPPPASPGVGGADAAAQEAG